MRNKYTEQLRTIIYGAAVGDALGVPFEFLQRDSFTCDSMTTGGVHNVARGTFSDDTSMLLATCDSIKQTSTIDPNDMRNRFCDWLFKGAYTADGAAFDVGNATASALHRGYGCDHEYYHKDCVISAVNLGDDSDTTACVAGALAGALYGFESIPTEWIEVLRGKEIIENCLF